MNQGCVLASSAVLTAGQAREPSASAVGGADAQSRTQEADGHDPFEDVFNDLMAGQSTAVANGSPPAGDGLAEASGPSATAPDAGVGVVGSREASVTNPNEVPADGSPALDGTTAVMADPTADESQSVAPQASPGLVPRLGADGGGGMGEAVPTADETAGLQSGAPAAEVGELLIRPGGQRRPEGRTGTPPGTTSPGESGDASVEEVTAVVGSTGQSERPASAVAGSSEPAAPVETVVKAPSVLGPESGSAGRHWDRGGQTAEPPGLAVGATDVADTASARAPSTEVLFTQRLAEAAEACDESGPGLMDRVAAAMRDGHARGSQRMRIRLHPPELGQLRVDLRMQGRELTARLETQTLEARAMILNNLDSLRGNLASHGIQIHEFEVRVQAPPQGADTAFAGGQGEGQAPQGQSGEHPQGHSPSEPEPELAADLAGDQPPMAWRLNVVV